MPLRLLFLLFAAAPALGQPADQPARWDDVPAPLPEALRPPPPVAAPPAEAAPWPWADAGEGAVTVLMAGDTNLLRETVADGLDALRYVAPTLRAADVAYLNLEAVPSGSTAQLFSEDIPHKTGWHHAQPEMADVMAQVGVDGVGLANNGAFPRLATARALDTLGRAGVGVVGGGMTDAEAREPLVFERDGTTVGFLQYTLVYWMYDQAATDTLPGVAVVETDKLIRPHERHADRPHRAINAVTALEPASLDRLLADVRRLAAAVDVAVVQFHWGRTGNEVFPYQRRLARAVADAGADAVVGHGPHRLQTVEVVEGVPVVYSLANFAFDWDQMDKAPEGLVARLVVRDGAVDRLSLVPLLRDADDRPVLLDPRRGQGAALYDELRARSLAPLRLDGAEIVVDLDTPSTDLSTR